MPLTKVTILGGLSYLYLGPRICRSSVLAYQREVRVTGICWEIPKSDYLWLRGGIVLMGSLASQSDEDACASDCACRKGPLEDPYNNHRLLLI